MIENTATSEFKNNDGLPEYLYKYVSLEDIGIEQKHELKYKVINSKRERSLDILRTKSIWFASPDNFNDPYDCAPVFNFDGTAGQIRKFLCSEYIRRYPGLTRNQRKIKARNDYTAFSKSKDYLLDLSKKEQRYLMPILAVLSLSSLPDIFLMWSHYANNHKGICYRFNTTKSFFQCAERVDYSDERPAITPFQNDQFKTRKSLLTKALFWAYENEWRVIGHPGAPEEIPQKPGLASFPAGTLDGVIFGAETSASDRRDICEIISKLDEKIEIYNMSLDEKYYKLNMQRISS